MSPSNLEILPFAEKHAHLLDDILHYTGRASVGCHYCLDYAFTLSHFDPDQHHKVLDIGCGPYGNALHDYMEMKFGIEVMGLDRAVGSIPAFSWPRNIVRKILRREVRKPDQIDFNTDLMEFNEGGWDFVMAISSLEHNQPEVTKACWQYAHSLVKPGGALVATFSIAGDDITKWNKDTMATDLSIADAEQVWDSRFDGDRSAIIESYHHPYLMNKYVERFGESWVTAPAYMAAGVVKQRN